MITWNIDREISSSPVKEGNVYNFPYPCSSHKECSPFSLKAAKGIYLIELWGAQGGNETDNKVEGGKGAYTSGILTLHSKSEFLLFIGASGLDASTETVFGGGGSGASYNKGGSGSGASDLRYNSSLESRIIVAGGGAGSSYYFGTLQGGAAGGLQGSNGNSGTCGSSYVSPGCGGNQDGVFPTDCVAGELGNGGNSDPRHGSGGGGGYYGGGKGATTTNTVSSGGGGSSYVSGYKGCVKNAKFVLKNPIIRSGKDEMFSPSGDSVTGNSNNGFARITFIGYPYLFSCSSYHKSKMFFYFVFVSLS